MSTHANRGIAREEGFSLIEVIMAGAISAVIFALVLGILTSVQSTVNREQERSDNNDQARLAIDHLDRNLRSASTLYTPDSYGLVATTLRNVSAPADPECAQWLLTDGRLHYRSWASTGTPSPTGWREVAVGVVNRDVSPSVPLFTLGNWVQAGPAVVARTIHVDLRVNDTLASQPDATVQIGVQITARNAPFGPTFPAPSTPVAPAPCNTIPPP